LKNRYKELDLRPFILSRSFYAGSQKWGFIWTGDNNASYESMKYSVDQLLSLNLCGYSACGADVGGFFNNPDEKLTKSWYQVENFNFSMERLTLSLEDMHMKVPKEGNLGVSLKKLVTR
jgi:alpha-glucosidase (family GH31 glycosyl hydrolase)